MWFLIEAIIDALAAVEWSTIADVGLGALLAVWVTHQAAHPAGRQVVIRADGAKGCHTNLTVNGHALRVLLDSGAIGLPLVLGSNHAADLGIAKASLDFSHSYSSANGQGQYALVRVREVTLAGWSMHDIPAVVTKAAQSEALLGAEYLHRLSFTTTDGYCTLTMPVEAARATTGD
jgi:clan AA aspartic protease (TIGR02281 family)